MVVSEALIRVLSRYFDTSTDEYSELPSSIKSVITSDLTNAAFGWAGINSSKSGVYIGKEPDEPYNCMTFFDFSSASPIPVTDYDLNDRYDYHGVQLRVRHQSYKDGWDWCVAVQRILSGLAYIRFNNGQLVLTDAITDTYDEVISCIQCSISPAFLDRTENDLCRFVTSFEVQRGLPI